nr:MAG TPA: hypothetical protein [Caudoviricetes sp.]
MDKLTITKLYQIIISILYNIVFKTTYSGFYGS